MNVLTIGTDRNLFIEGSTARARIAQYGSIVDEYHIIVFSLSSHALTATKIADNVWVYPTNSASKFLYMRDARRVAKTLGNVDLVSAQDPFECGLAASWIAQDKKARLQVQLHTDPFSASFKQESLLNRIRLIIARRVIPKADCIRVVSQRAKRGLQAAGIALKAEPSVLPIFVDVLDIVHAQPTFSLHEKYSQFNFWVLMVSRLTKEKRIDRALDAMTLLAKQYPKLGLVIVGDGPLRQKLAAQAEHNGIKDHVIFEGWQHDLVSYYKTASCYLLTSDYEGYGRTLIEAAASGLPIVTTDVGIVDEYFADNDSALIVRERDVTAIAQRISTLIEDNNTRVRLSYTAKRHVTEHAPTFDGYLAKMKEQFANCCRAG